MKAPPWLPLAGRMAVTLVMVVLALLVARWLWIHYQVAPWTRDGRIRADVVEVAPDVPGLVTAVMVADDQVVRRGQTLFVIDRPRYEVALQQAQAAIASQRTILAEAKREARRDVALGDLVSQEAREQSAARVREDESALAQASASLDAARLNLARTVVAAPVDGVVTNLQLLPGDYLAAGREALALVDTGSLRIDGYFEETKLPGIHIGDRVAVRIMGERTELHGHVAGIAAAIADRERSPAPNLVANVNPTFSWVRLAQRVPVRVTLDAPPAGVRLIAGRTVTVTILDKTGARRREGFWPWAWR